MVSYRKNCIANEKQWNCPSKKLLPNSTSENHIQTIHRNDKLLYNRSLYNIITPKQAGSKQGNWGCTDQLLINKMILDEAKQYRRNLHTMWFDYNKDFGSIPHDWILKALELAQVLLKVTAWSNHQWVHCPQSFTLIQSNWYHQISNWCFTRRLHGIISVHS